MIRLITSFNQNKKFITNSLIYFIGYAFAFLTPYIINPILINNLDSNSLAILSKFGIVSSILISLTSLGLTDGISVFKFKHKNQSFNKIIIQTPLILLISSSIFCFIFYLFSSISFEWSLDIYIFLFLFVFFITNYNLILSYFIVLENRIMVILSYIVNALLIVFFVYIFIVNPFNLNYVGRLLSLLIPPLIISTVFYLYFIRNKSISKKNMYPVISLWIKGIFFHTITGLLLANSDKLIILILKLDFLIVEYFFALQFLIPTVVFSISLNNAFKPQLYKKIKKRDAGVLPLLFVAIILILVCHVVFYFIFKGYYNYFIDTEIVDFWVYFQYLFWIYLVQNLYYPVSSVLFYFRKEKLVSKITSVFAIISFVIPYYILEHYNIFYFLILLVIIHFLYVVVITSYSIITLKTKNVV